MNQKNAYLRVFAESLVKAAEEGYEADGVDTVFGEKPGSGAAAGRPAPSAAAASLPQKKTKDKAKGKNPKKDRSCSMDKKAGFLDFLRNQTLAYQAMRSGDSGLGQAIVAAPLFESRVFSGATTGLLAGLLGAVLGGLAGAGAGVTVGEPVLLALLGAMAGSSLGFTAGNAAGQTKADKLYLADKGISAKIPAPVRPITMPFTLGAALPIGTHAKYETAKG